jgi:CRISPR type I-E-associated protein CasA/Cse1
MNTFNLLDEPWIPVLYHDGRYERVGIRKALADAAQIREIATSNPMDRVAVLRFLLALLYWCKGNPSENSGADSIENFPPSWFSKLDDNPEYFNLLGDGKRFYQFANAKRPRASTDLLQEIPTGNNFWHFKHVTDKKDGLCPACCAMGLLRLPLFSVSGLPDLKAGINGAPPIYVLPVGTSLFATLRMNWRHHDKELGIPAWIEPNIQITTDMDVPLITGLTLLSRRVWLHAPQFDGPCAACGKSDTPVIRTCEFQSAGKQENNLWTDPHVIYSNESPRKSTKAEDLTKAKEFRMDRPWPELLAKMLETDRFGTGNLPASFLIVGFATDQAKNIDVWERTISVPHRLIIQREVSATRLRKWRQEGGRLEKRVSKSMAEASALIAAIRPQVEATVSGIAGTIACSEDAMWKAAAEEYRPMMEVVAQALAPGFTTAALQRRRKISAIRPQMQPKAEPEKKSRKKKEANT